LICGILEAQLENKALKAILLYEFEIAGADICVDKLYKPDQKYIPGFS
jgi:hypothetical protein